MKILKAKIHGLNRFKMVKLNTVTLNAVNPVQIFIGDNGSGKTSLLNELNPFAAIKSQYSKTGYKKLLIEHNGITYKVSTDFGNKTKTHSFIRDGVELNPGVGTSTIQNELAATHLGYTSTAHQLLHYTYKMCSMSKADRKTFLLNINPANLSLVLEFHKAVCSRLREYTGNIKMLTARKLDIESKLMDNIVLDTIKKEKEDLEKRLVDLNNHIFYLKQQIATINQDIKSMEDNRSSKARFDIEKIKQFEKRVNRFLVFHGNDINKKDTTNEIKIIEYEIAHIKERIEQYAKRSLDLVRELETYDKNILEMDAEKGIETFKQELDEKRRILEKYKYLNNNYIEIIPDEILVDHYIYVNEIVTNIHTLLDLKYPYIYSESILEKVRFKTQSFEHSYQMLSSEYNKLNDQVTKCKEELNKLPKGPETLTEICTSCEYKNIYLETKQQYETYLRKCNAVLPSIVKDLQKKERVLKRFTAFIDEQKGYWYFVNQIKTHLSKCSFKQCFTDIVKRLNEDPNKLIADLKFITDNQQSLLEKKKLEKEITDIEYRIAALEKTQTPVVHILQEMYLAKSKELEELRKDINTEQVKINVLTNKQTTHAEFLKIKESVERLNKILKEYEQHTIATATKTFACKILDEHTHEAIVLNNELQEKNAILKEQEFLHARYTEEILKMLDTATLEKKKYEIIEWGTSPSTGFPHKQLVDHINILIRNVNVLINQVWTYPLKIKELDINKPIDYTFTYEADGVEINDDISSMSKAQQAITNLAFMFSFIITMNLCNYPVYLDEIVDGLDPTHDRNILEWLRIIVENKYTSQMWLINHDAALYEGFTSADILCLRDNNVVKPASANQNAQFD